LGSVVSTVAAAPLGQDGALLAAGTPGSYVFAFPSPVIDEPHWALKAAGPVNNLAIIDGERVVVGTKNGFMQVWSIK